MPVWNARSVVDSRPTLVVGVEAHDDRSIPPYESGAEDARLLTITLTDLKFQSTLLVSGASAGSEPTKSNITRQLAAIHTDGDVFLFSFTGNGVAQGGEFYLLPSDTRLDDLSATALSFRELGDLLRRINSRYAFLLLDVARAASPCSRLTRAPLPNVYVDRAMELSQQLPNCVVLSACRPGEYSYAGAKGGGLFMQAFVEGLRGACPADAQGNLTAATLASFVARRAPQLTRGRQNPFALVNGDASFVVVSAAVRSSISSALPAAHRNSPSESISAIAFEFTAPRLRVRETYWFVNGGRVESRRTKPVPVPYGTHRVTLTVLGRGARAEPMRIRLSGSGRNAEIRIPKAPVGVQFSVHFLLEARQPRHFVAVSAQPIADHLEVNVVVDSQAYRRVEQEKDLKPQTFWVEFL